MLYQVCGLFVDSELILPSSTAMEGQAGRDPDVLIRRADRLAAIQGAVHHGPNWALSSTQYRLTVPGVVDLVVTGGRRIDFALLGDSETDAAAFVGSTGLGALLHQRGDVVLHASAVQIGSGAAVFCGPSGAGKSTIAAALVERGYALVNDDFCAVRIIGDRTLLYPDGRQHKLWEEAVDHLAAESRVGIPVRPALRKFYVKPRQASERGAPLPIAAVYSLREDRRGGRVELVRLNLVDAARAIRRNAYRPMLTRLMGQQQLYLDMTARILRQAVVCELVRPLDFDRLPECLDKLQAGWNELSAERSA